MGAVTNSSSRTAKQTRQVNDEADRLIKLNSEKPEAPRTMDDLSPGEQALIHMVRFSARQRQVGHAAGTRLDSLNRMQTNIQKVLGRMLRGEPA